MYISEIASARYRGGLSCLNQLAITFGDVIVYSIGAIPSVTWQWLAIIPVMLSSVALLLMAFMPETPVWLMSHGKKGEALRNLIWLRGSNYDSVGELEELQKSLGEQKSNKILLIYNPFFS